MESWLLDGRLTTTLKRVAPIADRFILKRPRPSSKLLLGVVGTEETATARISSKMDAQITSIKQSSQRGKIFPELVTAGKRKL